MRITALILFISFATGVFAAEPLEIRFTSPASAKASTTNGVDSGEASKYPADNWASQAQPIGNGRLGAMVFGNPLRERIQFNENSLWTGGNNPSGTYSDAGFGAYQNFGDLEISLSHADRAPATDAPLCPSGQKAFYPQEEIAAAGDGDNATKWCVEHRGTQVVWQIDCGKPATVSGYLLTSANDVPERDPRGWRFEGSIDSKDWQTLDTVEIAPVFSQRGETKKFTSAKIAPCRYFRLVFAVPADPTRFQVAEIALEGVGVNPTKAPTLTHYSRTLNLRDATHVTSWQENGVTYTREVLASKPDEVIAIKWSADKPGMLSGVIKLHGAHNEAPHAQGNTLEYAGALKNGLRYAARIQASCTNGTVSASGDSLLFSGDSVVIFLAAATDYALDPGKSFRSGVDPVALVEKQLVAASAKTYPTIRTRHIADFSKLMNRVDLNLGAAPLDQPITTRLAAYKKGENDQNLEALLFQYGRYLLISCSRDTLPANLQGLWNDSNKPAWHCDYHTNINLQMCYWLAEPANLSECASPLFNWTIAMIPGSREATVKSFGKDVSGWTMRTSVNIFGGNGWDWNLPASAWIAQHFMEHYAFTGDKKFLLTKAWPIFYDVSEYWLGHLVEHNGKLLVPKGWSPEHGPREDGVTHDQQLIWDLFTNTLNAAKALDIHDPIVARVAVAREKLLGPQIGSWGQLMEWTTERPDLEKSHHRHTSHLFAVYPGNQITSAQTPAWAKAAALSLEARGSTGDSQRSWTWPWRTALWARLGRSDKAGDMIRGLLTHNTMENLFTTHPPFQIDGNLGITAGICETLVQSHAGEISVMPALPPTWTTGSYSGLRARGGFILSARWQNGLLENCQVESVLGQPLALRLPGNPREISVQQSGRSIKISAGADGTFRFPTKTGTLYDIEVIRG